MTVPSLDTVRDAFTSICEQFKNSIEKGDLSGIENLYTNDAKILPPNMEMLEGRDLIKSFWQGALEMGIKSYEPEVIEVDYSGHLGFFLGKYTLYGEDKKILNKGKFITVFKNIDGEWKVHRDIFNSSVPLEQK